MSLPLFAGRDPLESPEIGWKAPRESAFATYDALSRHGNNTANNHVYATMPYPSHSYRCSNMRVVLVSHNLNAINIKFIDC